MNERIKLLAEQAGITTNLDTDYFEKDMNKWVDYFSEKLAELIVKECATYMNGRTEDWDAKLRWIFNDGSGYMEVNIDSLLNEHFGVEE